MTPGPSSRRAALGFILATAFLDALSFGLIFPILPRLVVSLSGGDTADAARTFGLIAGVWALMNFLAAPVLGSLSDRYGRRPVILISAFGFSIDLVVMAMAPTLGWLFVGRMLSGLTAANYATAAAYIADVTPPDQRARRFGLMAAISGAGMILGPAAGGLLGEISPRAPFWAAAALAGVSWLYGLLVLPESLAPEFRTRTPLRPANPLRAFTILTQDRGMLILACVNVLVLLAAHAVNTIFVLYTAFRYHWGSAEVGLLLMVYSAGTMAVMGVIAPQMVARWGERATLLAGLALSVLGFAALGFATTGLQFCLACIPTCVGNMSGPALQALQSRRVDATQQGRLQGALTSLFALTGLAGPIAFTQIFALSIAAGEPPARSGVALLIGATLMAAAWLVALTVARRRANT